MSKEAQQALDKMAENAREMGLDYEQPAPVAEPRKQEPEWYHFVKYGEDCFVPYSGQAPEKATPLYTSPPTLSLAQRTWVGLTDEERDDLLDNYITAEGRARAIEAKLKEKNT